MTRELVLTHKERADVLRRRAAKGRQKLRGQRIQHEKARHVRERDTGYLSWLHEDLPCIACLVLGEILPQSLNAIEAAHQKINAPGRVQKRLGVRPDDVWTLPLCRLHHREGPLCCDPAQAKFWSIIGLTPDETADFCLALYAAYQEERDGRAVVHDFASLAAANRADWREADA